MTAGKNGRRRVCAAVAVAAGIVAAGCDIFYPPWLANGYSETVVLQSRGMRNGETSEFQWTIPPGVAGVHARPGTVYERIEVQDAAGERLQVFEGEALEAGCRALATNAAFPALLFEPSGTRWLSKKEFHEWRQRCEEAKKGGTGGSK